MTSECIVVAGFFGRPTSELSIPDRTMDKLTRLVFDIEGNFAEIDREIDFRAAIDGHGRNISEVTIRSNSPASLKGTASLAYIDGKFLKASIVDVLGKRRASVKDVYAWLSPTT